MILGGICGSIRCIMQTKRQQRVQWVSSLTPTLRLRKTWYLLQHKIQEVSCRRSFSLTYDTDPCLVMHPQRNVCADLLLRMWEEEFNLGLRPGGIVQALQDEEQITDEDWVLCDETVADLFTQIPVIIGEFFPGQHGY